MITEENINDIKEITNKEMLRNIPLKDFTTWKIGGPADFLVRIDNEEDLINIFQYCIKKGIHPTVLGKGSNVLISDNGIRGLVIINDYKNIEIGEKFLIDNINKEELIDARVDENEFNYLENPTEKIKVILSSGTLLSYSINYLIEKGITGLQWFAGIPGTIGGALFNNIHGSIHYFSEFIDSAKVIDEKGNIITLTKEQMDFGYDQSIFQKNKYIILEITLILNIGDKERALKTAISWSKKKLDQQVYNSAGCCFKNITDTEKQKFDIPSNSWGYIIDNILKLKGTQIGGAQISTKHAAFIENVSGASASDVLKLLDLIYEKAESTLHIKPKTEIFFLGFNSETIQKYI